MGRAEQIAAIDAALEIGAVSITDENGRTVNYGSRQDMLDAKGRLAAAADHASVGRGFAINTIASSGPRG